MAPPISSFSKKRFPPVLGLRLGAILERVFILIFYYATEFSRRPKQESRELRFQILAAVKLPMNVAQALVGHVGVNLGGGNIFVS